MGKYTNFLYPSTKDIQTEKKSVEVTHAQDVGLAATDVHADEDQETEHVSAVDDADSQVASEVTRQEVVEEVDSGGESCGKTGLMSVDGEDGEVGTGEQWTDHHLHMCQEDKTDSAEKPMGFS